MQRKNASGNQWYVTFSLADKYLFNFSVRPSVSLLAENKWKQGSKMTQSNLLWVSEASNHLFHFTLPFHSLALGSRPLSPRAATGNARERTKARTNQIHYPDLGSFDVISTEFLPLTLRRLSRAFPMAARGERGLEPRLFTPKSDQV